MKPKSEKRKYASAKEWAEKQGQNQFSTHLKLPAEVTLFKPKTGTMLIDILPYTVGEGNPNADPGQRYWTRIYYAHRGIGPNQETVICPRKTANKPCPICEHRLKLMKKGDDEDEEMIKDLAPKERQLVNLINLKEPDKGVQLWDVSTFLFGNALAAGLRNADEDDDWDNFFHLEGGSSLKVGFSEESFGGRSFAKAEVVYFKPRKEDYDEEILESVLCLDELVVAPKYDTLKKLFLEAAEPDEEDEETTDHDDEDRAPKKKKRVEEEEDEAPAPRKRKVAEDEEQEDEAPEDEEDEAPRRKTRSDKGTSKAEDEEDNWDDFDKPKKKKVVEEDEDEAPPRKKKPAEDEDDPEPEEEDEAPPKKKNRFASQKDDKGWDADEDEAEAEEEPPRKRRR